MPSIIAPGSGGLVEELIDAASGSVNINVPATAEWVAAFIPNYNGQANQNLTTLTLGGVSMLPAEAQIGDGAVEDAAGQAVYFQANPVTGATVALAWAWPAGQADGGQITLVFGTDTNGNPTIVRDAVVAQDSFDAINIPIDTETTDVLLAMADGYSLASAVINTGTPTLLGSNPFEDADPSLFARVYEVTPAATSTNILQNTQSFGGVAAISLQEQAAAGITGSGTATAQSATAAGTGERIITGTGLATAQSAVVTGVGERVITGTGTLTLQNATADGAGTVIGQATIELLVANNTELRDLNDNPVASLNGVVWEWYDTPGSTAGEPVDTGTFNTNANGEATFTIIGTSLANGQFGQLLIYHPSDPDIRATLRIAVTG